MVRASKMCRLCVLNLMVGHDDGSRASRTQQIRQLCTTAFATGELSDSSSRGVAVGSNFGHDWVADGEGDG